MTVRYLDPKGMLQKKAMVELRAVDVINIISLIKTELQVSARVTDKALVDEQVNKELLELGIAMEQTLREF